jgi:hypothetical protein
MNQKAFITSGGLEVSGNSDFNNNVNIDVTDHALFRDDVSINGTLQVGTNSLVITDNGISHTGNEFYLNTDGLFTDGSINLHGNISLSGNILMEGTLNIEGVDIVSRIDSCLNNLQTTVTDDITDRINELSSNVAIDINDLSSNVNGRLENLQTTISGEINSKINDLSSNVNGRLENLQTTITGDINDLSSNMDTRISAINTTLDDAGLTGTGSGTLASTYAGISGNSDNFFSVKDTTSSDDGNYALNRDSADGLYANINGNNSNYFKASSLLIDDAVYSSSRFIGAIDSAMSDDDRKYITFGRDRTAGNEAQLGFLLKGFNNSGNALTLGLYGNSTIMNILNSGNVGIGTTDPQYTLDVNGVTRVIRTDNSVYNSVIYTLYVDADSNHSSLTNGFGSGILFRSQRGNNSIQSGSTIESYMISGANTSQDYWALRFKVKADQTWQTPLTIRSDNSGRVGINTTTPSSTLHVSGNTRVDGLLLLSDTDSYLQNTSNTIKIVSNAQTIATFGATNSTTKNIDFYGVLDMNTNNITGVNNLYISGNVGIGTTDPQYTLDVDGNVRFTLNTGTSGRYLRFNTRTYGSSTETMQIYTGSPSGVNNDLNITTASNIGFLYLKNSNKRIGIGTTSPAATLDVSGTAKINGDLNMNSHAITNLTKLSSDDLELLGDNVAIYTNTAGTSNTTSEINQSRVQFGRTEYTPTIVTKQRASGYTDSTDLYIYTSGINKTSLSQTPRIFVKGRVNSSYVGIGTTNPGYTLDVAGTANANTLQVSNSYPTINPTIIVTTNAFSFSTTLKYFTNEQSITDSTLNEIYDNLLISTDTSSFPFSQSSGSNNRVYIGKIMSTSPTALILRKTGTTDYENVYAIISPSNTNGYFTDGDLHIETYKYGSGNLTVYTYNEYYDLLTTNTTSATYTNNFTIAIDDTKFVKYIVLHVDPGYSNNTNSSMYIGIRSTSTIQIKTTETEQIPFGCTISPSNVGTTDAVLQLNMFNNNNNTGPVYITSSAGINNFTGQHHNYSVNEDIDADLKGFIVISTGTYKNQMDNCNECNKYKVTINESLPIVDLSKKSNDKKVFGVISDKDDNSETKEIKYGYISGYKQVHSLDRPLTINSLGEGAIWVCNVNGTIENGDYITSSPIPGLGMIQNDDLLHNYTVAKSTMDCEFVGEQVPRKKLRQTPVMIEKTESKLIQQTQQKQAQILDESGNIIIDESGNPVMEYVFDDSGNPVMEGVTDESGNPVMVEEKDGSGNIIKVTVYDESGNPIMVQDRYSNGELKYDPVVDEQGNFIYDFIYDDSGNQLYTDKYESKYVEVFADKFVIYNDTEKTQEFYTYEFDFANGSQDQQDCIGNTYVMAFIGCTYHCG